MSYIPQIWVMMILILQDRAYFIDGHRLERLETWQQSLVSQVSSMTLADSVWGVQRGCCSKFSNLPWFWGISIMYITVYYIMIIFLTSLTSCFSGLNVLFRPKSEGHIFERVEKYYKKKHFKCVSWARRPQQWNLGMPPIAPNMAPKTGHPTMAPHSYSNMAHSQAPKHGTTLSKRCNPHAHTVGNRNPAAASIWKKCDFRRSENRVLHPRIETSHDNMRVWKTWSKRDGKELVPGNGHKANVKISAKIHEISIKR